jgi:hypothetical protein
LFFFENGLTGGYTSKSSRNLVGDVLLSAVSSDAIGVSDSLRFVAFEDLALPNINSLDLMASGKLAKLGESLLTLAWIEEEVSSHPASIIATSRVV